MAYQTRQTRQLKEVTPTWSLYTFVYSSSMIWDAIFSSYAFLSPSCLLTLNSSYNLSTVFWLFSSRSDFFPSSKPSYHWCSLPSFCPCQLAVIFLCLSLAYWTGICLKVAIMSNASWYLPAPGLVPRIWLCEVSHDWWISNPCNRAGILSQPSSSQKRTHLGSFPGTHENECGELAGQWLDPSKQAGLVLGLI